MTTSDLNMRLQINDLKFRIKKMGKGKRILLAADADREGDAIAWHSGNLFKLNYGERSYHI